METNEANMMETNERLQSKVIDFLRFPLCVAVVVKHSELFQVSIGGGKIIRHEGLYPVYCHVSFLLTTVSDIAVKLFFFISGYLFFRKAGKFDAAAYRAKMRKRAGTVLVPYLFWNLLMLLTVWVSQLLFPGALSGRKRLVADYGLRDWLSAFWAIGNGDGAAAAPIDYPLWFIRELMAVMALSPLVYFLVRRLRVCGVAALGALWVAQWWKEINGLNLTAWFFFTAGAWFGINRKDFVASLKPCLPWAAATYAVVLLVLTCTLGELGGWETPVRRLGIIAGMVCALVLPSRHLRSRRDGSPFLAKSSFFIYASHALVIGTVQRLVLKSMRPDTDLAMLAAYFLVPAVVVGATLLAYRCLKRWFPRFAAIVTGGR